MQAGFRRCSPSAPAAPAGDALALRANVMQNPRSAAESHPMTTPASDPTITHAMISTDGARLHTAQAGPRDGPLVILLHGFPETWYAWRRQMESLAREGFRVWAPDQRGYGESTRPRRIRDYRIDLLVDDVIGLIDAAGCERANLVGHDWGGAVAWRLAARHPERVERLAIANCPHPRVMARNVARNPAQTARSAYAFFFQLPLLPEVLLGARSHALLRRALRRTSRRGTFGPEVMEQYREAWSRPGAVRAMLNWYRAVRYGATRGGGGRIRVPTLILWGARDRFLAPRMAEQSLRMCEDGRLLRLEGATHWLHHEEPERVSAALAAFLGGGNSFAER
jgi:epoxide hydrolase 4